MEGWHPDGYPGNLAYSPELWEWMFALGLKLNFDPSHLMWLGIDPVDRARSPYVAHVAHVQAKDIQCDAERRNRYGFFGKAVGRATTPGTPAGGATGCPDWATSTSPACHRRAVRGRLRRHRLGRARGPGVGRRSRPCPHRPGDRVPDAPSADRRGRRRIIEEVMSMARATDTESVDVLIVGSGPAGSAYARTIADARPDVTILMVEVGPKLSDAIGEHTANMDEAGRIACQLASQGPDAGVGAPAARHQPGSVTRARAATASLPFIWPGLVRGRRARPGRGRGRAPGRQHVERSRRHGRLLDRIVPAPERVRAHPVHPGRRARSVVHTRRAAPEREQGPAGRRRPARRVA